MYYEYFGLKQPPFRITPDTEFFFEGANRGAVLEALTYAILHGEGIVKVTGEVGSGKTMLCRVLQARLAERVDIVYLANPSVSPEEILHAIAFELQLPVQRDAKRLEVMHALQDYLLRRHAEGRQVVVFVEESQGMPLATLEEIRLLSNLETDRDKLLQLVLFGQPELDENLRQNSIRQLRERITHSFYLSPLVESDIRAYLTFRLHAAGYRGPELFSPKVVAFIARSSGGLTRRVNLIADKALLAAFASNTHTVTIEHVKVAVRDSEFSQSGTAPAPKARTLRLAVIGLVLAAVALASLATWMLVHRNNPSAAVTSTAPADTPPARPHSPLEGAVESAAPAAAPVAPSATDAQAERVSAPASTLRLEAELPRAAESSSAAAPVPGPGPEPDRRELPPDFLERRLLATEAWLARQPEQTMTVQVLGSNDSQLLRSHLRLVAKYIDTERIFVYRTRTGIGPTLTVLVGSYATRAEALAALDRLPDELKLNRPYLRTVRGVRAEIEATAAAAASG